MKVAEYIKNTYNIEVNVASMFAKNCFSRPIITSCRSKELQNAQMEHSAILSTCN